MFRRYIAPFRDENASKATAVEDRSQISHSAVKISENGKIYKSGLHV